ESTGGEQVTVVDRNRGAGRAVRGDLEEADHPRMELAIELVLPCGEGPRGDREGISRIQLVGECALAAKKDRGHRRRGVKDAIGVWDQKRRAGRNGDRHPDRERGDSLGVPAAVREDNGSILTDLLVTRAEPDAA